MAGNSWAKLKNEQSVEKQRRRLDDLRRNRRRAQLEAFSERIANGIPNAETAKHVVRAIVEGDVKTYSPRISEIEAERHLLQQRRTDGLTRMQDLVPRVQRAIVQRERHLDLEAEWHEKGRRFTSPMGGASLGTVIGAVLLLIVLEGSLLTPATEGVIRTIFPRLSNVTPVAMFGIIALVFLGAVAIIGAAREAKEYLTRKAMARYIAGTKDDGREPLLPSASPTMAQIWALTAVLVQALLLVMRLSVETGDSVSRAVFLLVSAATAVLAFVIGLMEFRRYQVSANLPLTYDQGVIDEYLSLDGLVRDHIPRELRRLDIQELNEFKDELHEHQRYAVEVENPDVMRAIHSLIDDYEERIGLAKDSMQLYEPLDLWTLVTPTDGQAKVPFRSNGQSLQDQVKYPSQVK